MTGASRGCNYYAPIKLGGTYPFPRSTQILSHFMTEKLVGVNAKMNFFFFTSFEAYNLIAIKKIRFKFDIACHIFFLSSLTVKY